MSDGELPPECGLILCRTEDGQTRLQCRFEDEAIWLNQAQMAALFPTGVLGINLHLKAIFAEGEQAPQATIQSSLFVRSEGERLARNLPKRTTSVSDEGRGA